MIQLLPDPILSLLYPQACDVCDREVGRYRDGTACSDCWNSTRVFNGNETLCTKCGAFLFGVPSRKEMYCEACTEHFYDHAIAIGIYEKALAASVLRLKRIPFVPARLKGLIVEQARQSLLTAPTIVVPVPLSPRRYQERGFNQVPFELLATYQTPVDGLKTDISVFRSPSKSADAFALVTRLIVVPKHAYNSLFSS